MKKKKPAEFTGALGAPIAPRRTTVGMVMDPAFADAEFKRRFEEDWSKLMLLAQHFGTERGDFCALSLALARQYVPGFSEQTRKGAPSKWTDLNRSMLVVEMERLIVPENQSKGAAWAAKQLAKGEPWKSFIRQNAGGQTPNPAEVLRTTYQRSKKLKFADMARAAYKFDKATNKMDEWQSLVRDSLENPVRSFDDPPE